MVFSGRRSGRRRNRAARNGSFRGELIDLMQLVRRRLRYRPYSFNSLNNRLADIHFSNFTRDHQPFFTRNNDTSHTRSNLRRPNNFTGELFQEYNPLFNASHRAESEDMASNTGIFYCSTHSYSPAEALEQTGNEHDLSENESLISDHASELCNNSNNSSSEQFTANASGNTVPASVDFTVLAPELEVPSALPADSNNFKSKSDADLCTVKSSLRRMQDGTNTKEEDEPLGSQSTLSELFTNYLNTPLSTDSLIELQSNNSVQHNAHDSNSGIDNDHDEKASPSTSSSTVGDDHQNPSQSEFIEMCISDLLENDQETTPDIEAGGDGAHNNAVEIEIDLNMMAGSNESVASNNEANPETVQDNDA